MTDETPKDEKIDVVLVTPGSFGVGMHPDLPDTAILTFPSAASGFAFPVDGTAEMLHDALCVIIEMTHEKREAENLTPEQKRLQGN